LWGTACCCRVLHWYKLYRYPGLSHTAQVDGQLAEMPDGQWFAALRQERDSLKAQ
jgi:hypothetical protein